MLAPDAALPINGESVTKYPLIVTPLVEGPRLNVTGPVVVAVMLPVPDENSQPIDPDGLGKGPTIGWGV